MSEEHRDESQLLIPYPTPGWSRMVSLLLAIGLSAWILVFPATIAATIIEIDHTLLTLLMWGITIGFIHGAGFVPRLPLWRLLFHPVIGWLLMASGLLFITL